MLHITNLSVAHKKQPILSNVHLAIKPGSVHALMGPNGSGKSTLAYTLMGHPQYTITHGSIVLKDQDITTLPADKRARAGLFLAFQHPYAIPGVTVFDFLKEAHRAVTGKQVSVQEFKELLEQTMQLLAIDPAFCTRALNDGFSGGEKKRLEMLQLLMLNPDVAVLDEIDSGLDIDALKIVAQSISYAKSKNPALSILIITHYQRILDYVQPDCVHILCGGTIVTSGDYTLVHEIEQKGYDAITTAHQQENS